MCPHVAWPCSCPPRAPHRVLSLICPQFFVPLRVDPAVMERMVEQMMKKIMDQMATLAFSCCRVPLVQVLI